MRTRTQRQAVTRSLCAAPSRRCAAEPQNERVVAGQSRLWGSAKGRCTAPGTRSQLIILLAGGRRSGPTSRRIRIAGFSDRLWPRRGIQESPSRSTAIMIPGSRFSTPPAIATSSASGPAGLLMMAAREGQSTGRPAGERLSRERRAATCAVFPRRRPTPSFQFERGVAAVVGEPRALAAMGPRLRGDDTENVEAPLAYRAASTRFSPTIAGSAPVGNGSGF